MSSAEWSREHQSSEFINPFHCRSNNRRKNGKSAVSTALALRGRHASVSSVPLRESPPNNLTQRRRGAEKALPPPFSPPAGLTRKGMKTASGGHENLPAFLENGRQSLRAFVSRRVFVPFRVRPSSHRKKGRQFRRNRPTKPRVETTAPDTRHQAPRTLSSVCSVANLAPSVGEG